MHVCEKVGEFLGDRVAKVKGEFVGHRSFTLRIATTETLKVVGVECRIGRCSRSFEQLGPGGAGTVTFEHEGEHSGSIEFLLGDERLCIGQHTRAGIAKAFFGSGSPKDSRGLRPDKFVVEFVKKDGPSLQDFNHSLPKAFANGDVIGTNNMVHVQKVVRGKKTEFRLLVGSITHVRQFQELQEVDSVQHLGLAELCQAAGPPAFASAILLGEFEAVSRGLCDMKLHTCAYALDLLIHTFVAGPRYSRFCGAIGELPEHLNVAVSAWRERSEKLGLPKDFLSLTLGSYEHLQQVSKSQLDTHMEEAHILLRSAALHCASNIADTVAQCKLNKQWPPRMQLNEDGETNTFGTISGSCRDFSSQHAECNAHNAKLMAGHLLSMFAGAWSTDENQEALTALIRRCIDTSAKFNKARLRLLSILAQSRHEDQREMVLLYAQRLPATRRSFDEPAEDDNLPAATFESFSSELFSALEDCVSPDSVLRSLGSRSKPYRALSTNSKSGEFFMLSHDSRFLIKTISEAEGQLLFKMSPAYQDHIRIYPQSLLCRFAGLFSIFIPGSGNKFFAVMTSVFDPHYKIHVNYDLKGSLHHRNKKNDEFTGKDGDWVDDGQRLRVPYNIRRQILAAHEVDAAFMVRFGVIDYSVLVGIHHLADSAKVGLACQREGIGRGTLSEDKRDLYFVGMVDFLIFFGSRKKAEHILKTVSGHGDTMSCVDPMSYAVRQVRFMREAVVETRAIEEDSGTAGMLVVDVIRAETLINMDGLFDKSDPYVVIDLGLQSAWTETIMDNLNPEWNTQLHLPVNTEHLEMDIRVNVWDEDHKRTQGSDDFLGRLTFPMAHVAKEKVLDICETLQGVKHGKLALKLTFQPLNKRRDRRTRSQCFEVTSVWEYAVDHVFESLPKDGQQSLELQYLDFKRGTGPSTGHISLRGIDFVVDFEEMTRQVEGSAEKQSIRRREVGRQRIETVANFLEDDDFEFPVEEGIESCPLEPMPRIQAW